MYNILLCSLIIILLALLFVLCFICFKMYNILKNYTFKESYKMIDSVTGIYNKDKFYHATQKILCNAKKNEYAIFRCDINRFKVVNEVFGHKFGDMVLRLLASSIKELAEGVGTYGHLENDVFLMCLPVEQYSANEIYSYLSNSLLKIQNGFSITLCIGIYIIDDPSIPVSIMCDKASFPLRDIKGKIVDGYAYYDNLLHSSILKEQKLFFNINAALSEHQFEIYLQPIYNLKTLKIEYAEALIRWKHPTKGLLPPSEFLPYAEKNGFINAIDVYVWTTVCNYLSKRKESGKKIIPISVNISRASVLLPSLTKTLKSLVKDYNLNPSDLKLEITEDSYMNVSSELSAIIKDLKDYGFEFFMDDFGSGYSSLGILRDIPFNVVKIDKVFLDDFGKNSMATKFLMSILNMTKILDIPVIMEGAETKEEVDFLISNGFDYAQGYYFSKPIIFSEFEKFLEESNQ